MNKKVVIIGAGFVGSTIAYSLLLKEIVNEIVLIDVLKEKGEGEIMDLKHAREFVKYCDLSFSEDYSKCKDADIVIITAGARQRPGESRLQLISKNVGIFRSIMKQILKFNRDCIFLVVSNPVDILTYVGVNEFGLDRNKVIGSGTSLDSSRFKCILGDNLGIKTEDIDGMVLGEHGDSSFPVWSSVKCEGAELDSVNKDEIANQVRVCAPEVVKMKGATYYGVSSLVSEMVKSVLKDEKNVFLVSTLLNNYCGISDVCLSVPCIIGKNGVEEKLTLPLEKEEIKNLKNSSKILKEFIKKTCI